MVLGALPARTPGAPGPPCSVYEERVRDVRIFYNPKDRDRGTGRTAPDLIADLTQTAKPAGTV